MVDNYPRVYAAPVVVSDPREVARQQVSALSTSTGFVLGDVIAQLVLDSGIVIPRAPVEARVGEWGRLRDFLLGAGEYQAASHVLDCMDDLRAVLARSGAAK